MASGRDHWTRVKDMISKADVVIFLVDARDVEGTSSKKIEELAKSKKKGFIIAINKIDLLPKPEYLKLKNCAGDAILVSAKTKRGLNKLKTAIYRSVKKQPVSAAIVGYPNVGKSLLSNALKGKSVAPTASRPGHTRGEQWVKVSKNLLLFDTPGVIPEHQTQTDLAMKRSIDLIKIKDPETAAIGVLKKLGKEKVMAKYGLYDEDQVLLLEKIAIKYGKLMKGGVPDTANMAKIILRDWYK